MVLNKKKTTIKKENKIMKKRTLALVLVLALTLGAATVTLASAANTNGSIEFESRGVIIIPPGGGSGSDCGCACEKCCESDRYCDANCNCGCPCDCKCGGEEGEYNNFFNKIGVEKDLYFGSHDLTVFGIFDSANNAGSPQDGQERYTGTDGKFTGVEVINKTAAQAKVGIEIGPFMVGGVQTLAGAELTLKAKDAVTLGATSAYTQGDDIKLTGSTKLILSVNSGRQVRAAWYGVLETFAGTAVPGKAQALLTWTDATSTL